MYSVILTLHRTDSQVKSHKIILTRRNCAVRYRKNRISTGKIQNAIIAKLPSADCLIEMAEVFDVPIDTLAYGKPARHCCRTGFYILVLCGKELWFYAKFVETRNEPCYFNITIAHNLQRFRHRRADAQLGVTQLNRYHSICGGKRQ